MITIYQAKTEEDFKDIKNIMLSPEILETAAEEDFNIDDAEEIIKSSMWFIICHDGQPIGVYQLVRLNRIMCEMHANILKKYRGDKSRQAIPVMQKIMLDLGFHKYVTSVPIIYSNVISYCKLSGFSLEGVNRESFLINGVAVDQAIMGITAKELRALI